MMLSFVLSDQYYKDQLIVFQKKNSKITNAIYDVANMRAMRDIFCLAVIGPVTNNENINIDGSK